MFQSVTIASDSSKSDFNIKKYGLFAKSYYNCFKCSYGNFYFNCREICAELFACWNRYVVEPGGFTRRSSEAPQISPSSISVVVYTILQIYIYCIIFFPKLQELFVIPLRKLDSPLVFSV